MTDLYVYNFKTDPNLCFEPKLTPFILRTCQRVLYVSSVPLSFLGDYKVKEFKNREAYSFLLNVISGLESALVAESEIINQFKIAFSHYLSKRNRDSKIIKIIEVLFKDSKEIRTRYLNGIAQKTYSSIIRTQILKDSPEKVLIIGSGKMSKDLINQLRGKTRVYICARNSDEIKRLEYDYGITPIDWLDYNSIQNFSHLINTIGSKQIIFNRNFLENWKDRYKDGLFVDIGSPSCLEFSSDDKKNILMLEDIFEKGVLKEKNKIIKINNAKKHIGHLSHRRFNIKNKHDIYHVV